MKTRPASVDHGEATATGFVKYDGECASSDTVHGGKAGMRYSF